MKGSYGKNKAQPEVGDKVWIRISFQHGRTHRVVSGEVTAVVLRQVLMSGADGVWEASIDDVFDHSPTLDPVLSHDRSPYSKLV